MLFAAPTFILLSFLSAAFVCAACVLVYYLSSEDEWPRHRRWLASWSVKGLLVPCALWALMNIGLSWRLQPFMPEVQVAKAAGAWFPAYLRVVAIGLFVVSSYWATVTLGWTVIRSGTRAEGEARDDFKSLCWLVLAVLGLPAAGILWLGGWTLLGTAALLLLAPMAGYGRAMLRPARMPPMYARAVAKLKFGKYADAEWEIIRELEKGEDDFEGWMMLAELYANHFNDISEAEQTILEICDQPRTTPSQLSVALHRLADWQLTVADNPDAARAALEMICTRLPGTHLAHMARLRIGQLPKTADDLRAQRVAAPVPLPALGGHLDDDAPERATASDSERTAAAKYANECVAKLKQDPNDVPARERLARLFAERLDKADLGIEQIQLLLDMPGQSETKRVEWMALLAAWHIRYRHDWPAGRELLVRITREFPGTVQAFAAQQHIEMRDLEEKARRAREAAASAKSP